MRPSGKENKKKEYLWGLAFWGFIPIKTKQVCKANKKLWPVRQQASD